MNFFTKIMHSVWVERSSWNWRTFKLAYFFRISLSFLFSAHAAFLWHWSGHLQCLMI